MRNNLTYTAPLFTESFEGVRLKSYQDVRGRWTVGVGHVGPDVTPTTVWTMSQALAALAKDMAWAAEVVNTLVHQQLNQDEFNALVDFVFNVGSGNFQNSQMLALLNEGKFLEAAQQFEQWDRATGVVVAGLLRRRVAEEQMFEEHA